MRCLALAKETGVTRIGVLNGDALKNAPHKPTSPLLASRKQFMVARYGSSHLLTSKVVPTLRHALFLDIRV